MRSFDLSDDIGGIGLHVGAESGESSSNYAMGSGKSMRPERAWAACECIDAAGRGLYIAGHDPVLQKHTIDDRSGGKAPSPFCHGTGARSRVKARAAGAAALPSPKIFPQTLALCFKPQAPIEG